MRKTKIYVTALLLLFSSASLADVWVNGQRMNGYQLSQLAALAGEPIPSGRYWLAANGNWGYEGNYTVQGNLYTQQSYSGGNQGSGGGNTWSEYDPSWGGGGATKYKEGCHIISSGAYTMDTCDM